MIANANASPAKMYKWKKKSVFTDEINILTDGQSYDIS
jgi:hypothetical protein